MSEIPAHISARLNELYPGFDNDDEAMEECRLMSFEIFWRDHYLWLEKQGYRLRSRYHPDWVASWKDTDKNPDDCEDGQPPYHVVAMLAATRISDGQKVLLKKVYTAQHPFEAFLAKLFSAEPQASHASNHCVPVYDVLRVPGVHGVVLIAMPFLSLWFNPGLETVGEAVQFFMRLFEGLQYMHSLQIAHNDIKGDNIMMDHSPLYDDLPHPANADMKWDWTGKVQPPRSRTARPVKYYYIDFGLSKSYYNAKGNPCEPVKYGGDLSVPEFLTQDDCNPFAVDVYRIGNVVRRYFTHGSERIKVKHGLEFMKPLLQDMCQDDPTQRPDMDEVVSRFSEIVKGLSCWKLRSRLVDDDETRLDRLLRFPTHWMRQAVRSGRRMPAIPKA